MTSESHEYEASCHCGKAQYKLKTTALEKRQDGPAMCNCSICQKNGYVFIYPQKSEVTWTSGEDELSTYTFNKKMFNHKFCPACGTSMVCTVSGTGGKMDDMMAVNIRTFKNIDIDEIKIVKRIDGRAI